MVTVSLFCLSRPPVYGKTPSPKAKNIMLLLLQHSPFEQCFQSNHIPRQSKYRPLFSLSFYPFGALFTSFPEPTSLAHPLIAPFCPCDYVRILHWDGVTRPHSQYPVQRILSVRRPIFPGVLIPIPVTIQSHNPVTYSCVRSFFIAAPSTLCILVVFGARVYCFGCYSIYFLAFP
ncbi:hypothetical protein H4582DRAFT_1013918 [Lactarius indigo]|nr:hypothetical protein H4582DRAFT_1013918 [Lactarius indigo]